MEWTNPGMRNPRIGKTRGLGKPMDLKSPDPDPWVIAIPADHGNEGVTTDHGNGGQQDL